jgi:hypothetical protein
MGNLTSTKEIDRAALDGEGDVTGKQNTGI